MYLRDPTDAKSDILDSNLDPAGHSTTGCFFRLNAAIDHILDFRSINRPPFGCEHSFWVSFAHSVWVGFAQKKTVECVEAVH